MSTHWMTTAEVAEHLGVASQTVLDWAKEGNIPQPRRFSRRTLRWPRAEINDYIEKAPRGAFEANTQI